MGMGNQEKFYVLTKHSLKPEFQDASWIFNTLAQNS
jgi:hypothetical protein